MCTARLRAIVMVAWLAVPAVSEATIPADAGRARFSAALHNYAAVPAWQLRPALAQVVRAFARVGISLEWRAHPGGLAVPEDPQELTILLLSPDMVARKCAADGIGRTVLARAAPSVGRAWVFANRVQAVASSHLLGVEDVLGRVIAHELGHMLLQDPRIDLVGAMQEQLITRTGYYSFTGEQGVAMRRALRAHSQGTLLARKTGR